MKFREYSKLNLSDVNKDVLKLWEQENVFAKSIDERDGAPTFVFYEEHLLQPTVCQVFTMCWRAPLKTSCAATRP